MNNMEENKTIYQLGMRDMISDLFMQIRVDGVDKTLKGYAEMLPDNPHTKHYLENVFALQGKK